MGLIQSRAEAFLATTVEVPSGQSGESLRDLARQQAYLRHEAIENSQKCYHRDDHEGAARWSAQSKEHDRLMDQYNAQASEAFFRELNPTNDLSRMDLHGQFVKEAEQRVSDRIRECRQAGITTIQVIVGKGLHSEQGVAKIKPAILRLIEEHQLKCNVDPNNAGVIWVELVADKQQTGLFGWIQSHCCVQ